MRKNKEFEELLAHVAEIADVPKKDILDKNSRAGGQARRILCHVIYNAFFHLRESYVEYVRCTKSSFNKNASDADEEIHSDVDVRSMINEVRKRYDLPPLKHAVTYRPVITHTKTLFGFDYTELDALRFRNACRGAKQYMRELCSVGRQPIPEGMVFTQKKPKRTYDSWYKE